MKRVLCVLLATVAVVGLTACGGKDDAQPDSSASASAGTSASAQASGSPSAKATAGTSAQNGASDQKATTEVDGKHIYIASGDNRDTSDVCYHLEDCEKLEGYEKTMVSVELVQTMGFQPCEICKPPVIG